ncbi:MAG TPA: response regulator [Roseiflexaceae bacterium]|nr:response regulator [Roseiflexaceae bacterium]
MEKKPLRILLVEDDGSIARIIVIAMRDIGVPYALDQAYSAEEGLELWERQPYDLVLTDYNLRGMSGTSLIAALKARAAADLPTVLFTAYDDARVQKEARAVGVTRFVSKPFVIEEFVRLARELLPVNASEMGSPPAG